MIMVDCLQVFSVVLAVPGHGGRAQSLKVIHACGGLVLNRATVKNHSFLDSVKYRCEATLDLHLLVSIYFTSWCSNWLRRSICCMRKRFITVQCLLNCVDVANSSKFNTVNNLGLSFHQKRMESEESHATVSYPTSGRQHRLED